MSDASIDASKLRFPVQALVAILGACVTAIGLTWWIATKLGDIQDQQRVAEAATAEGFADVKHAHELLRLEMRAMQAENVLTEAEFDAWIREFRAATPPAERDSIPTRRL